MTLHLGYYHWKISVLNLLRESSHRSDEHGPMLTSEEQRLMENTYSRGASPEFFVQLLKVRDLVAGDTSIGAPKT